MINDYHLRSVERRAQAEGLVVALSTAEVREVGEIIHQLRPLRWLVLEKLKSMAQPGPAPQSNKRRNAALALLADDPAHTQYLVDRIMREDVHPHEICVVRRALLEHDRMSLLAPRLWRLLVDRAGSAPPNLGAAGALASFAPDDPRWVEFGGPIAAELVSKSPTLIGDWREVFQPVQRTLADPLRAIFGDIARPRERALAFSLLFDFAVHPGNSSRDRDLAELIPDTNPDEFLAIRRAMEDRGQAVAVLLGSRDQQESADETMARRRGRVAACLIVLQSPDRAWQLLRDTSAGDLGDRTELIHDLAAYDVPADAIADRLVVETDASARRALILALGEYSPSVVPEPVRRTVTDRLLKRYATDTDPGTHSAIDWLFRARWDLGRELDSLDESWRGKAIADGREWFVNSEGMTMALVTVAKPLRVRNWIAGRRRRSRFRRKDPRRSARSFVCHCDPRGQSDAVRAISRVRRPDGASKQGEQTGNQRTLPSCRHRLAGRGHLLQLAQPARKPATILRDPGDRRFGPRCRRPRLPFALGA